MATVPPRIDAAPDSLCPTCGQHPTPASFKRYQGDIVRGLYACAAGHVWETHWVAGGAD